ncbi:hypothetical protein V5F49_19190 [Xanthobacter sp. V3C-3]|uniref:hypothetical protein n=1 Tax=Xanthobacter lutulentifluminis TaxID=3119935 RepID=UPI003726B69C
MRDPKTGFAVVQVLAPAFYSGDDIVSGSFFGPDTIRRIPGPAFDLAGFNSAALIVNVGASNGGSPPVVTTSSFGLGIQLQQEAYPGTGIWEDSPELQTAPGRQTWYGLMFLQPGAEHTFHASLRQRKYRLVAGVRPGYLVAASALLLKGHPTQRPSF